LKRTGLILLLFLAAGFTLHSKARAHDNIEHRCYDESLQKQARVLISEGRLEEALGKFRSMLDQNEKEIWTAQTLLVCEAADLETRIESLEKITAEPVIVIKRVLDSKTCFRVCAGVFRNKAEAVNLTKQLPSPFREAKPYPLLLVSKGAFAKGAFDLDVPKVTDSDTAPPETIDAAAETAAVPEIAVAAAEAEKEKINYDAAQNLFMKGLEAYSRNNMTEAESLFRQSIALKPERFEAYNNLGAMLIQQKKYEDAKDVLEKAVGIQPAYANARSNLAGAYWFLDRRQEAISEAQRAFRLDSHNVRYGTNLASFLYEEKRYSDAQIYLNVVKMIDPANEDALAIQKKVNDALGIQKPPQTEQKVSSSDNAEEKPAEIITESNPPGETEAPPEKKKKEKKPHDEVQPAADKDEAVQSDKPHKRFRDIFKKKKSSDESHDKPQEEPKE
jgi:tetratricopeptide (TPR) repeat protein